MIIERPIFDEFVERFVNRAKTIKVGDPLDASTEMGPLITPQHRQSVQEYMAIGDGEGAQRACGGETLGGALAAGNFLTPAVYVNVADNMRVAQEEIFGPVEAASSPSKAKKASAWRTRPSTACPAPCGRGMWVCALRVSRAMETGMISVNSSSSVHIEAPFGGVKASGIGREQGMVALDHYSEYKSVFIAND